jgi:hypothetical protein
MTTLRKLPQIKPKAITSVRENHVGTSKIVIRDAQA